jgi:hypothetical protein
VRGRVSVLINASPGRSAAIGSRAVRPGRSECRLRTNMPGAAPAVPDRLPICTIKVTMRRVP